MNRFDWREVCEVIVLHIRNGKNYDAKPDVEVEKGQYRNFTNDW